MDTAACSSSEGHAGVVLTTPRMVLRAVRDDDLPALHRKIFGAADVMQWAFGGVALSLRESESFIHAHMSPIPSPTGLAVVVDRSGGAVLGIAGLNPCAVLAADDLEIGFVLAREAWGRGLATEIGRAQLRLGFEQLGRRRLLALAAAENIASVHTLTKLGMQHHSEVRPAGRALRQVYCVDAEAWRSGSE